MWKSKNFRLSIVLGVLILITGVQLMRQGGSRSSGIEAELFTTTDTLNIETVQLTTAKEDLVLRNTSKGWFIGDERADEYYISLLKAVLARVRVQREVTASESEQVAERMANGARVHITLNNGSTRSFKAGGDENQTRSYFTDDETGITYVVNIPGYQSFVSGIFFLSELEWKDKTLFQTPWTAITDLSVNYPEHPEWNFSIRPGKQLLRVEGLDVADTTVLMDYAMIFSNLKANYFFKTEDLDSLAENRVFMEINVEDLDQSRNNRVLIYELKQGNTIQFGVDSRGQIFGLDYRNVNLLAIKKEDFLISN